MRSVVLLAALAALSVESPAGAQTIDVPEGCTPFLTVQFKGCTVSHYWRCQAGPDGAAWQASYDADGPVSLSLYDREFQWVDSQHIADASREFLVEPVDDPASMTELLETGRDTYDFVIREERPDGTRDVRHEGFDELSGREIVIDGEPLLETLFSATASDAETGEEIYRVAGRQYVMAVDRLFLLGEDSFMQNGQSVTGDRSPVSFHRPGEAGFGLLNPQFGCGGLQDIAWPGDPLQ